VADVSRTSRRKLHNQGGMIKKTDLPQYLRDLTTRYI